MKTISSNKDSHALANSNARRAFLLRCGRFAAATPPVVALLLSASKANYAVASSGGNNGGDGPNVGGGGGGDQFSGLNDFRGQSDLDCRPPDIYSQGCELDGIRGNIGQNTQIGGTGGPVGTAIKPLGKY